MMGVWAADVQVGMIIGKESTCVRQRQRQRSKVASLRIASNWITTKTLDSQTAQMCRLFWCMHCSARQGRHVCTMRALMIDGSPLRSPVNIDGLFDELDDVRFST